VFFSSANLGIWGQLIWKFREDGLRKMTLTSGVHLSSSLLKKEADPNDLVSLQKLDFRMGR
jgi:hypothetical protein